MVLKKPILVLYEASNDTKDTLQHDIGHFFNIKKSSNIDDENEVCILPILCIDVNDLINKITQSLQTVCNKNLPLHVKIVFFLLREYIPIEDILKIHRILQGIKYRAGYSAANIKIVLNACEPYFDKILQTNFICLNYFNRYMFMLSDLQNYGKKHTSPLVKKSYEFLSSRKYKFSSFIGQIASGRVNRAKFFFKCIKENIFDDNFFWSLICIDYINTFMNFNIAIGEENTRAIFHLIKHNVVKEDGTQLTSTDHIYKDHYEYQIPQQMYDSYINVVHETVSDIPSLTEKIYKPLIAGVPFIWHGAKDMSSLLRKQGYKLYPFIDYTFDTLETSDERLSYMIKEILRLKKLCLKQLVNDTKDIAEYNRQVFFNASNNMNDLYTYLK